MGKIKSSWKNCIREMATRSTTRLTASSSSKTETKVVKLPTVAVGDSSVTSTAQTNSKQPRRDVLVRQPSYCKILDDIKGTEAKVANLKEETIEVTTSVDSDSGDSMAQQQVQTITINGQQNQIVNPSALSQSGSIQTITVGGEGAATSSTSGVVQYAATSQNGQTVFIPGTVASASASGPQIISVATTAPPTAPSSAGPPTIEEASRRREIRLLKNREAARECRNKKKEYIKCLENRVAILENQNKALIEELKSLKEL